MNQAMSERRIFLGYAVDVFGPMAAYFVTRWLGISVFWGLTLGIGIALASTAVNTIRRRKLDGVGVLVLVEIAVSIGVLFWLKDPRLILIKPSFYTGVAAGWLMVSAFSTRPLSLDGSKPMATKGDPGRTAAWERAWRELPQFRLAHRLLTFGFGVASLADAVLRVVVVYRYPLARAAWLSNLPHMAAIAILVLSGALFGRWAGPMVDGIERNMAAEASPG